MTTAEDKQNMRREAYFDLEALLVNEASRSRENWLMWHEKPNHNPDRLKMRAYWYKKLQLLNSLLLKLSKLSH